MQKSVWDDQNIIGAKSALLHGDKSNEYSTIELNDTYVIIIIHTNPYK